jgi:hypothetical protein
MVDRVTEHLPRSLSDREADLLQLMLSVEVPGIESLREQARSASVVRECSCGCGTIDFGVQATMTEAVASGEDGPIVEAGARDKHEHSVELLLFVCDGRLSSLEIVWYDESQRTGVLPPTDFWATPTPYAR